MDPTADVPLDAAVNVPLAAAVDASTVPEANEKEHTYISDHSLARLVNDAPLDAAVDASTVPEATEKEHTYKFEVQMSCGGCSGAVQRALDKAKENAENGISSFNVSLEKKEVIVKGAISYDDAHATISKTGKKVLSGETVE